MYEFTVYLSWVYADQEPESLFQYVRKQSFQDAEKYGDSIYNWEFHEFYYSRLFTIHPYSHSINFLDYHIEKCRGNKSDFITFVKWSISLLDYFKIDLIDPNDESLQNSLFDLMHPIANMSSTPIIKDLILDWIEKKKEGLDELPIPPTKTNVSHPQQILLFHELGIIEFLQKKYNLGIEKTAKLISLLANRGIDNTGDYIRYLTQTKERTAKSKINLNPKTSKNLKFIDRTLKELGLSE